VVAGFPCQPISLAGQRLGVEDDRWLWPLVARVIRDVRPEWVFLENVPEIVRHGGVDVLGDLTAFGFDAEWQALSAAEVGASHARNRFWLLAHAPDGGEEWIRQGLIGSAAASGHGGEDMGGAVADAGRERGEWVQPDGLSGRGGAAPARQRSEVVVDAGGAVRHIFAPGQDAERGAWVGVEPVVRRVADGGAPRLERLHGLGNGVVPLAAASAYLALRSRFERGG
jgi:DNA (cytosine-5)-methyltransferase 1